MRAIALAVIIGTWSIECAVRGIPTPNNEALSAFIVAFIVCLIFGW